MSYLKFDKNQLVNLEYSLQREVLRTNRAGLYCCTTISGCNTRKYHGLLIVPNEMDGCKHVLLSSLDETIIQHGAEFNLGIHKYQGEVFEPKGHKYIRDFEADLIPITTYRVGGVVLTKERLMVEESEQLLIRYTLVEAHSPTFLRFKPFLAFRNVHHLSQSNLYVNNKYEPVERGISMRLYNNYPTLYMQFSKGNEYVHNPDWYNNIEYIKEKARGYEYLEDLYVPGYFEMPIEKGESIIFSASTFEDNPRQLKQKFIRQLSRKTPRSSFFSCLKNSAEQLLVKSPGFTDIQAGYPWYNGRITQTFVALPGLSLAYNDPKLVKQIIDNNLKRLMNGLFPQRWGRTGSDYDNADASLWFFWTIQKLTDDLGGKEYVWKTYKKYFIQILEAYKNGTDYNIHMLPNGLIHAETTGVALTWMNAYAYGKPVTPRYGCPVEINALWYNALAFSIELAELANDKAFAKDWKKQLKLVGDSFIETYWNDAKGYLADCWHNGTHDWTIRPNMIIAAGLPYSPMTSEMKKSILSLAKRELLTSRGLRTLSPGHPNYHGVYEGNENERESAMHQGTVLPWLLGAFVEGYLSLHKKGGIGFVKSIIDGFVEEMTQHCISTISELYNGNPPHKGKGAISQAWNIGEILRAYNIITEYER
jgi:predicted glycogen debranching enzyme